jgi:pimeloyl-ACP methyl ester carboxylesterase
MDVDWRAHQRWVTLPEGPVNVIDIGSGPPVLLVHGLGGSWQNWLLNILPLADVHRVLAVDLPGFGASPLPAGEITMTGYARTLERLATAVGIDGPLAAVGNSMGGLVAAELALVAPARVERLVLVSSAGLTTAELRGDPVFATMRRARRLVTFIGGWTAAHSDALARRPRLRRALAGMVVAHPERLPAPLLAEQIRGSGKPGFFGAMEAILAYPLRDRLSDIVCPTLIVWGDRDRLVPVGDADEFERLIGHARKVVYEDVGHMPMLEAPERFNADVLAFLAEERAP